VVSHDRELLEAMDAIVELTTLGASRYGGPWSHYRERKAIELAAARHDLAAAERRASELARKTQLTAERQQRRNAVGSSKAARGGIPRILLGARREQAETSGGSNSRLAERRGAEAECARASATARIERLEPLTVALSPTGLLPSRQVLRIEAVTAGYEPGHPIVHDVSLAITGPERVAVLGPNGSGKSTLLRLATGDLAPLAGEVVRGTAFAFFDQQVGLLKPSQTIAENFARLNPGLSFNDCRAALARFQFRAEAADQRADALSGGQTLRAGLACVLGSPRPPPFILLDEPTNHLDLESIEAVEAGLRAYDGALLVVSHDEAFLEAIGITGRLRLTSLEPQKRLS
jgi:ATPase subunit of ABC transporter with duplicated ATPase domains